MADERAHPTDDDRDEQIRHHDEEIARLREELVRTRHERDQLKRVSPAAGRNPVWSPDGRELFYRGLGGRGLMVAQIDTEPSFRSRTPELLFSLGGDTFIGASARRLDLAPDGDRFIFGTPGTTVQTSDDADFNGLIFVENWFDELQRLVPTP